MKTRTLSRNGFWFFISTALILVFASAPASSQNMDLIKGPVCVLTDSLTGLTATLSPEKSKFNVVVTDGLAHIQLIQMYVNKFARIKDMVYVFPLPATGSVNSMAMEYHDSLYQAKIYKKEDAQAKYDSVVNHGGTGALLIQDRPNIFQQHIANITKGDTAYVSIGISMPLKYNNGEFELAIPTMIGERYQSTGQAYVPSSGTLWNPPANRDGQTIEMNVLVQTGFPITGLTSPTHPLKNGAIDIMRTTLEQCGVMSKTDKVERQYAYGAVLVSQTTYPNKDYVLRFSRKESARDFTLASYYNKETHTGHFAMNIFPDTTIFNGSRPNLEIVLLIDKSGSQDGWPITKEKEIGQWILSQLLPTDRVAVLAFNTELFWAFGNASAVPATEANVTIAKSFINNINSGGGTDMLSGVNAALATPQTQNTERYYIFLTDGFVTNEEPIITAIRNHPSKPTVFTFGCGNSINRYLIDQAAATGNGGYGTVVTQNESITPFVNAAWEKIESPQMKNITIDFGSIGASSIVMPSGTNLFKGRPVEVYAQYTTGGNSVVTVKGDCAGKAVEIKKPILFATEENMNIMVPQVWARQAIEKLSLDEGTTTKNKDIIIEFSMTYQVLSKYTAFLAINPQIVSAEASLKNQINVAIEEGYGDGKFTKIKNKLQSFLVTVLKGVLQITLPSNAILEEFNVYNLSGKCVFMYKSSGLRQQQVKWDGKLSSGRLLTKGCYIVSIKTDIGMFYNQFMWK